MSKTVEEEVAALRLSLLATAGKLDNMGDKLSMRSRRIRSAYLTTSARSLIAAAGLLKEFLEYE